MPKTPPPGCFLTAKTILGLPGKIDNANTRNLPIYWEVFLCLKHYRYDNSVVAADHIGQSRSARFSQPVRASETSPAKGKGTARRRWRGKVGRPRAIVSCKAPVSRNLCALAHVRREASPLGVMPHYGCVSVCRVEHRSSAGGSNKIITRRCEFVASWILRICIGEFHD